MCRRVTDQASNYLFTIRRNTGLKWQRESPHRISHYTVCRSWGGLKASILHVAAGNARVPFCTDRKTEQSENRYISTRKVRYSDNDDID